MRKLKIFFISFLGFFLMQGTTSAQTYFSKSIDVGESSNTIRFMMEQDGLVLMQVRHFCPQPGFVSCIGLIVYDYHEGIIMDTMYSSYPSYMSGARVAVDFISLDKSMYGCHCFDNYFPGAESILTVFKIENETGTILDSFEFSFCPTDFCNPTIIKAIPYGGKYIFGQARDSVNWRSGYFLARVEENLQLSWMTFFPLSGNIDGTVPNEMIVLPNEDIILAGNLHSWPYKYGALVYVSSEGEELWRDFYIEEGSTRREGNAKITQLLDGEHFLLSWVMDTLNTDVIDRDSPKFIKYNFSGDRVDSYEIPAPFLAPVEVHSITTARNGDIIAAGQARVSQKYAHGALFRFSPYGELRWMKLYHDDGHGVYDDPNHYNPNMRFYDVVELPDGSLLAGGSRMDTVGLGFANVNAWLVRVDAEGNCLDTEACGQLEITEVVITSSTNPVAEVEDMILYPNPARDRVYVRQLPDQQGSLYLFDADGRLLKKRSEVISEAEFDLGNFPAGLYFVEFRSGDGRQIIQGRVVKQ